MSDIINVVDLIHVRLIYSYTYSVFSTGTITLIFFQQVVVIILKIRWPRNQMIVDSNPTKWTRMFHFFIILACFAFLVDRLSPFKGIQA